MASYAQYLSAISGKFYSSNYFYSAAASVVDQSGVNGVNSYDGRVAGFSSTSLSGEIQTVDSNTGTFSLGGTTYQIEGSSADGSTLVFTPASGVGTYVLPNSGTNPMAEFFFSTSNNYVTPNPTCFVRGTRIRTVKGEMAIESLEIGDEVIIADGRALPIKWIGHRRIDCARHPWAELMHPIEFAAGSVADNVPARAVRVSPSHAILVEDGWIINAGDLVNGSSIRQVHVQTVEYYHIELEEHAIVYAEGLPAETFVDVGNRGDFDNGGPIVFMHPRFVAEVLDGYCADKVRDREVIGYYRAKYRARAASAFLQHSEVAA